MGIVRPSLLEEQQQKLQHPQTVKLLQDPFREVHITAADMPDVASLRATNPAAFALNEQCPGVEYSERKPVLSFQHPGSQKLTRGCWLVEVAVGQALQTTPCVRDVAVGALARANEKKKHVEVYVDAASNIYAVRAKIISQQVRNYDAGRPPSLMKQQRQALQAAKVARGPHQEAGPLPAVKHP
ncbi:hypothetical protein HPB52_019172 [Rhipicephalus sanguineus]|uniref:Uncharacterized protein n=1 Tax=Rhipicephalus sanguineus TaxID=34632 RepID=A0A9D4TBD3_RHISA|nr:hypothetical protein HPB52_019172 [Rhipicephalus sanguineus]